MERLRGPGRPDLKAVAAWAGAGGVVGESRRAVDQPAGSARESLLALQAAVRGAAVDGAVLPLLAMPTFRQVRSLAPG